MSAGDFFGLSLGAALILLLIGVQDAKPTPEAAPRTPEAAYQEDDDRCECR